MTRILSLLFLLGGLPLAAQTTTTVTLRGDNCRAVYLYEFNGIGFDNVATFEKDAEGNFSTQAAYETPVFRYVGSSQRDVLPIIVGADEQVTVRGNCGRLKVATLEDSPANAKYKEVKQAFTDFNQRYQTHTRAYLAAQQQSDSAGLAQNLAALNRLDADKQRLLTETRRDFPLVGRVVSLNTYLSYLTQNRGRYPNELDYFAKTYFQFVDFEDEAYGELPWTYEGARNFTTPLMQAVPGEELGDLLGSVFAKWPAGGRAKLYALSGSFAALMQRKHPAAGKIGEMMTGGEFAAFPKVVAQIEKQTAGLASFTIGAEAPTFTGETPEGDRLSLESLRGKIVLIDFWASWCGPCRRENPKVVKAYAKYKDQGFEILGVSLDRTKSRWVDAIAKDGLTWPQVSDLQGWKSEFAKLYGVTSIPHTVLLDAEGKILARNLRGHQLDAKLKELFPRGK